MRGSLGGVVGAWAIVVACGSSTTSTDGGTVGIHASDFDQSCTAVSDCVMISEGTGCCLACQFAGINKADTDKYQAKLKELQTSCVGAKCALPPCAAPQLACTQGKCSVCVGACAPSDAGSGDAASGDAQSDASSDAPKD